MGEPQRSEAKDPQPALRIPLPPRWDNQPARSSDASPEPPDPRQLPTEPQVAATRRHLLQHGMEPETRSLLLDAKATETTEATTCELPQPGPLAGRPWLFSSRSYLVELPGTPSARPQGTFAEDPLLPARARRSLPPPWLEDYAQPCVPISRCG